MRPHVIRLRGFWTATEAEAGRVRHVRPFGRPRTLDAGETVWLVGVGGPGRVVVNGRVVGAMDAGPFAFEITSILQVRNTVEIELPAGESLGDMTLEIRR